MQSRSVSSNSSHNQKSKLSTKRHNFTELFQTLNHNHSSAFPRQMLFPIHCIHPKPHTKLINQSNKPQFKAPPKPKHTIAKQTLIFTLSMTHTIRLPIHCIHFSPNHIQSWSTKKTNRTSRHHTQTRHCEANPNLQTLNDIHHALPFPPHQNTPLPLRTQESNKNKKNKQKKQKIRVSRKRTHTIQIKNARIQIPALSSFRRKMQENKKRKIDGFRENCVGLELSGKREMRGNRRGRNRVCIPASGRGSIARREDWEGGGEKRKRGNSSDGILHG